MGESNDQALPVACTRAFRAGGQERRAADDGGAQALKLIASLAVGSGEVAYADETTMRAEVADGVGGEDRHRVDLYMRTLSKLATE